MIVKKIPRGSYSRGGIVAALILGGAILSATVLMMGGITLPVPAFADIASTSVTVGNEAPTIANFSLNGGGNIGLIENTSTSTTAFLDVSDTGGCATISSVTAKLYRTSEYTVGTNCSQDDLNCYVATCSEHASSCTGGADQTATYICTWNVWYIAQPSDVYGFATDIWAAAATTSDSSFGTTTATNTAETVELSSLLAHDVTATIPYGSVPAGTNTGNTNSTTTVTNTGNRALDTDTSGTHLCTDYPTCAGATEIATSSQEYALAPFTMPGGGTDITGSAVQVLTLVATPTATTTAVTDLISWGIEVAGGTVPGSYTGENTLTPVASLN